MHEPGSFFLYCLGHEKDLLDPVVTGAGGELRAVPLAGQGVSIANRATRYAPGQYCLGGICAKPEHRPALARALVEFDRETEAEADIWVLPPQDAERAFDIWLRQRSLGLVRAALAGQAAAELDQAQLRIEYQALLERYEALVRHHGAMRAPTRVLAGTVAPTAAALRCPPQARPLSQMLPCQPAGLAEVQLHLQSCPEKTAPGSLVLTLEIRHSDIRHVVTLEAAALQPGWNAFRFPRALTEDSAFADVRLHWSGDSAQAPTLSLGRRVPLPEARVLAEGQELPSPLAMRLWKAVPGELTHPGLSLDGSDGLDAPETGEGRILRGELSWGQLASLRFVGPKPDSAPQAIVSIKEHEGLVVVHPVAGAPVTAVVDGLEAGEIHSITGLFHLAYRDCNPVEVAIGLAPATAADDALLPYLGDWHPVAPLEWVEVRHNPALPADGLKRIVVATRMAEDRSPAWAWAAVARITVA